MESVPSVFAGIDWSMTAHQACLLRPGQKPVQRSFAHSAAGLEELARWLAEAAQLEPGEVPVAIEVPHGPVVACLVAAGYPVFSINPKQLDRFRDRHSLAGAKDDRRDAFTLADSLRTDPTAFSTVHVADDLTVALRAASRRRDVILGDLRRFTNRLFQQVWASYPDLLALCPAADEPWFWTLLERLSAAEPRIPREAGIKALLKSHRKRNVGPQAVLCALRQPPTAQGAALRAILDDIASLLPQLHTARAALVVADRRIATLLAEAGEVAQIVDSMPGLDVTLTAVFLAEAQEALISADLPALRTLCGTAPVTVQSGRTLSVHIRRACNPRLRNAVRLWARTAARCVPWARTHYLAMRARGHKHERALRGLADCLLVRLAACLRTNTRYDPSIAARRLSTT